MKALVLGSGVSGLSCAVALQQKGFSVRILTKDEPLRTTSSVAGAVWYPYRAYPQERVLGWATASLHRFEELSREPGTGVTMVELQEFFRAPENDPWWRPAIQQFRRLAANEVPEDYVDGYAIRVPVIETPIYLPYLAERFVHAGGSIEIRRVENLEECAAEAELIVNCTGLGARELCRDPRVFPIQGQVVRTTNPGIARVRVDEHHPGGVTYVIARSADCILGATAVDNDWSLEVDPEVSRDIWRRCIGLEPRLQGAIVLEARVGLRPGRDAIRLEAERLPAGQIVIHNYGHGGAGVTLSWGCAFEVAQMAENAT